MLPVISTPIKVLILDSSANDGIGNAVSGALMGPTDDWKAITRQLRMYATGCNTRHVLVMDEGVGIYFRFPSDPSLNYDPHDYLYASTELGQSFDGDLRLSLRELVVFALFAAFDTHNIQLHDFTLSASTILIGPTTRPYQNVLPSPPPETKKRPGSDQPRRQAPKRGKRQDSAPQKSFDRMVVGTTIQLELLPAETPALTCRQRASSLDSGFCEGTDGSPKSWTNTTVITSAGDVDGTGTASVTVERLLKENVAVVTDGKTHFIAKMFPPYNEHDPNRHLNKEVAVYRECASLQGTFIPSSTGFIARSKGRPTLVARSYSRNTSVLEGQWLTWYILPVNWTRMSMLKLRMSSLSFRLAR